MTRRSVKGHAGLAKGLGVAMGVAVEIGTPLAARLLEVADEAAIRAAADLSKPAAERSNDQLDGCLVAILCAHAALEARMNEAGELLGEWWADRERLQVEQKWTDLVERRSGTRPRRGSKARLAVRRLTTDRNRIAHFRGVPLPGGGLGVSGPPVTARGGISVVRAYFDAQRAGDRLSDRQGGDRGDRPLNLNPG